MSNGVHPAVHPVQPASSNARLRGLLAEPEASQLGKRNDPVLVRCQLREPPVRPVDGLGFHMNPKASTRPDSPLRWASMRAFVCIVEVRLHFGDVHDLKGKRKLLKSLKDQLRRRFGASVAEVDGQDKWQRSTLVCALVGGSDVGDRADGLERFVESRHPDGASFERDLLSLEDLRP
jgi:uncharacterized protein YlxP (DUF503 family)